MANKENKGNRFEKECVKIAQDFGFSAVRLGVVMAESGTRP